MQSQSQIVEQETWSRWLLLATAGAASPDAQGIQAATLGPDDLQRIATLGDPLLGVAPRQTSASSMSVAERRAVVANAIAMALARAVVAKGFLPSINQADETQRQLAPVKALADSLGVVLEQWTNAKQAQRPDLQCGAACCSVPTSQRILVPNYGACLDRSGLCADSCATDFDPEVLQAWRRLADPSLHYPAAVRWWLSSKFPALAIAGALAVLVLVVLRRFA